MSSWVSRVKVMGPYLERRWAVVGIVALTTYGLGEVGVGAGELVRGGVRAGGHWGFLSLVHIGYASRWAEE
jgi:hypothetical protein